MPWTQIGDSMRIGYDDSTGEYGVQLKLTNKTSSASVKGTVVQVSTGTDRAFSLEEADGVDPTNIAYEAGVADGSDAWCWCIGSICEVLLEDSTAATRGYWVKVSDSAAGRADASNAAPPGGTISAIEDHFSEIGHAVESKTAGTDVLCRINFHVN